MTLPIRIRYSTIDHFSETRTFRTLAGARAYAMRKLGTSFDIGAGYAVDAYGTGKITVSGVTLTELLGLVSDEWSRDELDRIENPDEWEIDAMMAAAAERRPEFPTDHIGAARPDRFAGVWAERVPADPPVIRLAPSVDDDIEF